MIKTIIFDLGGVILKNAMRKINTLIAQELGLDRDYVISEVRKINPPLHKGKMSEEEFYKKFAEVLKTSPEFIKNYYTKEFEKYTGFNDDVVEIVKELKKKFILAVLSNTYEYHAKLNEKDPRFRLFDLIIFSHRVGMRKPDREIYKHILKRLNIKPDECIFIDDLPKNVEAAKNMGIKGILFQNAEQLKEDLKKLGVDV